MDRVYRVTIRIRGFPGKECSDQRSSAAGIGFGVMTLIVILSVMNGFQMGYIDSILEVSSYHVRLEGGETIYAELQGCRAYGLLFLFLKIRYSFRELRTTERRAPRDSLRTFWIVMRFFRTI